MKVPLITIATVVALGLLYVLFPLVVHTYQRFRHKRVLKCPETEAMVEVNIDAPRAAFSSALGKTWLRIKNCTLWPKRKDCRQDCLKS